VICKPGGKISTIRDEIQRMNNNYNNITLVVGGNDCSNQSHNQAGDIVRKYEELVDISRTKCKTVTVSSVCPRLSCDTTQKKIESVNAGLLSLCAD